MLCHKKHKQHFFQREIFAMRGPTLKCSILDLGSLEPKKYLHVTLPRNVLLDWGDNADTTFRGHRPLKFWKCKKRAKFSTFNNNYRLSAEISM